MIITSTNNVAPKTPSADAIEAALRKDPHVISAPRSMDSLPAGHHIYTTVSSFSAEDSFNRLSRLFPAHS